MYPTLFTIGRFSIPTYTILLDLGLILGLVLAYFEGKRLLKNPEVALDLGLWTVIGGILGGRIGHVVAYARGYSEDWSRALRIWEGGLSFHGAFLGGVLVILVFALIQRRREKKFTLWELTDVLTLGFALGLIFGWAACLMSGSAYGVPGEGFGYAVLPNIYGEQASRFATQPIALILAVVMFVVFWLLRKRWPYAGASFLMFCLLYFGSQFFLESTRHDEAIYLGAFRLAQVFDLALALVAAVGLMVQWGNDRRIAVAVDEEEEVMQEAESVPEAGKEKISPQEEMEEEAEET
jgi:phosphatidylglycerol:prolipoprotein diacylglycerol transferase